MAQPSSKISEAFCGGDERKQGDARLRGDSVNSNSLLGPLTCAEADVRARPRQRRIDEFAELPRLQWRSATSLAPEGPFQPPQMAPGLKGFNIDHGPPRGEPIGDSVAIEPQVDARRLLLFEPSRASESSSDGGPSLPSARLGKCSAALNTLTILGIFAVIGVIFGRRSASVPRFHNNGAVLSRSHQRKAAPPGRSPKGIGQRAASTRGHGRTCVRWGDRHD